MLAVLLNLKGNPMEKYKNYIRINSKDEQKQLKMALYPDKKYLEKSLADDLFAQYSNSTCFKTQEFPCMLKFDKDAYNVMQAYNSLIGKDTVQDSSEEKLDFFIKPCAAYLSDENILHHGQLVEAVSDFFDGLLMYY